MLKIDLSLRRVHLQSWQKNWDYKYFKTDKNKLQYMQIDFTSHCQFVFDNWYNYNQSLYYPISHTSPSILEI